MYYGSDEIFCKLALNEPLTTECIYTQRIWHNHFIKVDNDTLFDKRLVKIGVKLYKIYLHRKWHFKDVATI